MDEAEPMDGAMGLPVKEEEGAYESAEEDQPSEEELQKWIKILSKSKKYQILPVGATGVGAIPKHTLPMHLAGAPGPSKPPEVSSPVSIQVPQQLRLATFSGDEPTPKGEVSYLVWQYEIKCLMREKSHSENTILQAVRRSLKGFAGRTLLSLGEKVTLKQILDKLDGIYGIVYSGEAIMQQFYTESQKVSESAAVWACRIEDLLQRAVEKGHVEVKAKNDMLRNKFWTGLVDDRLKNASRHKYDTVKDFGELLREVRKIEQEVLGSEKLKKNAQHHSSTVENSNLASKIDEIAASMQGLIKRMDGLERKVENNARSGQHFQSGSRGKGQGQFSAKRGGRRPQHQQHQSDLN